MTFAPFLVFPKRLLGQICAQTWDTVRTPTFLCSMGTWTGHLLFHTILFILTDCWKCSVWSDSSLWATTTALRSAPVFCAPRDPAVFPTVPASHLIFYGSLLKENNSTVQHCYCATFQSLLQTSDGRNVCHKYVSISLPWTRMTNTQHLNP